MTKSIDSSVARQMFRKLGANLDSDLDHDLFSHPDALKVPWLIRRPQSNEELAENLYERLRAAGVEISLNIDVVDAESIFLAEEMKREHNTAVHRQE